MLSRFFSFSFLFVQRWYLSETVMNLHWDSDGESERWIWASSPSFFCFLLISLVSLINFFWRRRRRRRRRRTCWIDECIIFHKFSFFYLIFFRPSSIFLALRMKYSCHTKSQAVAKSLDFGNFRGTREGEKEVTMKKALYGFLQQENALMDGLPSRIAWMIFAL